MWFVRFIYVTVLCALSSISKCDSQKLLNINDNCVTESGSSGICLLIEECPSVLQLLKNRGIPKICRFQGASTSLCCPIQNAGIPTLQIGSHVGEKSRRACKSYEYLSNNITSDNAGNRINVNMCPWKSDTFLIAGSDKADIGEFPHMATVIFSSAMLSHAGCSGTLISDKFVMTLAACLNLLRPTQVLRGPVFVRLGNVNTARIANGQYVQDIGVKKFHKHPDYTSSVVYHDIGLVELARPARINPFVKPACLNSQDTSNEIFKATFSGFAQGAKTGFLLKSVVDVFPSNYCEYYFRINFPNGFNYNYLGCYDRPNSEICWNRSGSPLVTPSNTADCSYDVIGMTLHGKGCGYRSAPVVFIKIYPYIEWIESIVWP